MKIRSLLGLVYVCLSLCFINESFGVTITVDGTSYDCTESGSSGNSGPGSSGGTGGNNGGPGAGGGFSGSGGNNSGGQGSGGSLGGSSGGQKCSINSECGFQQICRTTDERPSGLNFEPFTGCHKFVTKHQYFPQACFHLNTGTCVDNKLNDYIGYPTQMEWGIVVNDEGVAVFDTDQDGPLRGIERGIRH